MSESKLLEFSDQLKSPNKKTLTSMVESDREGESKMKRARHGASEENVDRLSDLPDCILLQILAFMNIKGVVQTCVLSKRWKNLWKQFPDLKLHSSKFKSVQLFTKFVTKVLSCRDGSAALRNLDFQRLGYVKPKIMERIVSYAVSHNVEQLRIYVDKVDGFEFAHRIFSCQSLTSLELSVAGNTLLFPESLRLRALTNLNLSRAAFSPSEDGQAEPFSACKKLHTLVIESCSVRDAQILCISNTSVAKLTISSRHSGERMDFNIVLSTPNLQSFALITRHPHQLVGSNLSFLEEVYIEASFSPFSVKSALVLNSWLQVFPDAKSMTLSSSTLEVLCLVPYLRNAQSPCFRNLNSLKVQAKRYPPAIPSGIVDYLLQNSPSAEVSIINDEDFYSVWIQSQLK